MSRHFSPTSLRDVAVDVLTSLYISEAIAEAIPPAYTEHIGTQLLAHLANEVAA